LQRAQPVLVVAPRPAAGVRLPVGDPGDQRRLELRPGERAGVVEGDRHAEGAALPRLGEHQLAVRPGRRGRTVHGERGRHGAATFATPTRASRVISGTSSSSERCSVPAGRSGSTSQRTSLTESRTMISTSSARSRPISLSTFRGSRTTRARYAGSLYQDGG